MQAAATTAGGTVEVIAPAVGGVKLDDGSVLTAQQMIGGAPSVLYDAIALVTSEEGAAGLANEPAAKQFVTDAHAHAKFIGHTASATALLAAAGVAESTDDGYYELNSRPTANAFIAACRDLRFWARVGADT